MNGILQVIPARIVIDPGAEINYVDKSFCHETVHRAEIAKCSEQALQELDKSVSLSVKGYYENIFLVVRLPRRYDPIVETQ